MKRFALLAIFLFLYCNCFCWFDDNRIKKLEKEIISLNERIAVLEKNCNKNQPHQQKSNTKFILKNLVISKVKILYKGQTNGFSEYYYNLSIKNNNKEDLVVFLKLLIRDKKTHFVYEESTLSIQNVCNIELKAEEVTNLNDNLTFDEKISKLIAADEVDFEIVPRLEFY